MFQNCNNIMYLFIMSNICRQVCKQNLLFLLIFVVYFFLSQSVQYNNIQKDLQMKQETYKIILIGDCRVGKTSYINNIVGKITTSSNSNTPPTIGVEYTPTTVRLKNHNKTVKAHIWDTSGAEKYKSITSSYYRKCQGVIIMCDITQSKTFDNLKQWLQEVNKRTGNKLQVMIIANKIDLVQSGQKKQAISEKDLIDFCLRNNLTYFVTSAISGYNVVESFNDLVEKIYQSSLDNPNLHQSMSDYNIINTSLLIDKEKSNTKNQKNQEVSQCSKCC